MRMLVKDIITEYSVRNKEGKAYPVYSVTNSQGFCKDYFGKEVASKDKSSYKIVPYGFFAYNPSRINVGSIDWQHCEENVIVSPLYNVFEVNTSIAKQEYLSYYFKSRLVSDFINTFAKGTVRLNVPLSTLGEFPIPVPSLSEQQRIVSELDLLSSIIEKKKAQLKEYDQLAQSIFYDMFGDPVTNEKGWEKASLSKMGLLARGVSKHRPRNAPELLGGTMPLIQTGDVSNADFYIRNYNSTYSELGVSQSKIWKAGTLCITIAATIGKCAILSFDACFPDSVVGFTVNNKLCNNEYVFFIFKCLQSILEENAPSVAQKNINLKVLNDLELPLPPLPLQQSFASKIEAIERQKALIQQSIAEVQMLFDSRMDDWFA